MDDGFMNRRSRNLVTLTLRRVARSRLRNDVSQRALVTSQRRLIESSDVLTKLRAHLARSDAAPPAGGAERLRHGESCSTADNGRYSIFVSCNKCGGIHDSGISVMMQVGFFHQQSLLEAYNGNVPQSLSHVARTMVTCPLTGRQSIQKDEAKIFLVPIKNAAHRPA
jgi:hypothetical protein